MEKETMASTELSKFSSTTGRESTKEEQKDTPEAVDFETALDIAGYGSFSRSVLVACMLSFFAAGLEYCALSYVLPAARCDLELSTYDMGIINVAFMGGGIVSAFFWGIAGDVFGRRKTLSITLLLNSVLTLAQSTVPDYRILLAARTINGFLIGAPATLVLSFLTDLVGEKRRQLYVSIVSMSYVTPWLVSPGVAWLVIPIQVDYATVLPVYSWRMYLAIATIPGFVAGVWMLCLPESPRQLADTNREDQALSVLAYIHKANNGKDAEFQVKKLIQDSSVPKTLSGDKNKTMELFMGVLRDLRILLSKSYAIKSSLILFVFFANMAAGFGLNMWIPEVLVRMQARECPVAALAPVVPANTFLINDTDGAWKGLTNLYDSYSHPELIPGLYEDIEEECNDYIDREVFISGMIVGACCVLGSAACGVLTARSGAWGVRISAAACAAACGIACASLAASACGCSSSNQIAVIAAAVLSAASLNGNILLIQQVLLSLPPKLSALGVSWGVFWGRAGGLASNLAMGILLDLSCPAPFIAVAALLALSVGAIMVLKLEENKEESA